MNTPRLNSLVLSESKGWPLRLRVLLPPNLPQTAPRDKIAVKLEAEIQGKAQPAGSLDRGRAYWLEPPHLLAALLVEHWCDGKLGSFLQLTREQLAQLLAPLAGESAVFWTKEPQTPLAWEGRKLPEVHPLLDTKPTSATEPEPCPAPAHERPRQHSEGLTPMQVDGSLQFISITLPSRESMVYQDALDLVKQQQFKLDARLRRWFLRGQHATLNFLAEHWATLQETYRARFTPNFQQRVQQTLIFAQLQAKAEQARDGTFSLDVHLKAPGADSEQLHQALAKGQCYVTTASGQTILLARKDLQRVQQVQDRLRGKPGGPLLPKLHQRVRPEEVAAVADTLAEAQTDFRAPAQWEELRQALRARDHLPKPPLPSVLEKQLRPYQLLGVAWLWNLYQHQLAGILADEMGLGKTAQALSVLAATHQAGHLAQAPCLVVAPASLLENWRREAARFAPALRCYIHHGPQRATTATGWQAYQLIITSYGTLTRDADLFASPQWAIAVADEAQHVKNRRSQAAAALRRLQASGRFVLTGTPLENTPEDLVSLFDFLLPGYLPKPPARASAEDRQWRAAQLRQRAAPYLLRRTKELVAPELPPKIERVLACEMTAEQQRLYQQVQTDAEQELTKLAAINASEGRQRLAALNQLLRLRQICADPRLLDNALPPEASAKLAAFQELLEEVVDGGHRMLVFSQFTQVLQLLKEELQRQELPCCYLDGSTPAKARQDLVDTFNNDPTIPVFLISLKAGGTGLNLTGANTVVHFDPWWNPAAEAQATDRAHRIGQTRTVTSIKLVAASTVEEKVVALQQQKARWLAELFEAADAAQGNFSLGELRELMAK